MSRDTGQRDPEDAGADLVEGLPAAILISDSFGRVLTANRRARELLGLSLAQLEGREAYPLEWKAVREDGSALPLEELPYARVIRSGQSVIGAVLGIWLPAESRWRWLMVDAVPEFLPGNPHPQRVCASLVDVTELRNARSRFQASERRFRGLFDNLLDGFAFFECLSDQDGSVVDFRFLAVNPVYERIIGRSAGDLVGRTVRESFGHSQDDLILRFAEVAQKGGTDRFELGPTRSKRFYDVVAYRPEAGSFAILIRDVTAERAAERALRGEKERLELTIASIGEGVIASDASGAVILMNPVAQSLSGWPSADALGKPLSEVFRVLDARNRAPLHDPVRAAMEGQGEGACGSGILLSRSGEEHHVGFNAAPLHDGDGGSPGAVLVFRDEEERRKLDDQIARSQRLESLGTLAGGIAHDFNNLLGGVFGYIDLARASLNSGRTEKTGEYLASASGVFERARSLTRQLLTFSRGGAPDRRATDLAALAKERVAFALSGSNVACSFWIPEGDWTCDIDPAQISQVIESVVLNATEAMPAGGSLAVSLSRLEAAAGGGSRLPAGSYLRLSLADSGPGVPEANRDRIFDPFFSTREGHTGLGLATAYSIMNRHSGSIEIDPAMPEGRGASFSLYLPVDRFEEAPSQVLPTAPGRARLRVIFMDDEDYLRQIAEMMLKAADCEAVVASTGEEALRLIKEAHDAGEPYDLAIMDLTIPGGLGGLEARRLMPDADPEILCVATSGYSEDPVMADPAKFGFAGSMKKPFRQADLDRLLASLGKV